MWQMTYCIKYLHDLHVWHRDLKSQNVFVSWEGGQLVAKVRPKGWVGPAQRVYLGGMETRPNKDQEGLHSLEVDRVFQICLPTGRRASCVAGLGSGGAGM
jgi:serine/threonine protein kinase